MDRMFLLRLHNRAKSIIDINKFGKIVTGKQALSLTLPTFNYSGGCTYYKKDLEPFIQYKPTDKQLIIELGEIKEGYFDNGAGTAQ